MARRSVVALRSVVARRPVAARRSHLLRLHLRLEERWLAQRGCLCPGHRAAHCEAVAAAAAVWEVAETLRDARLPWLMELQQWFHGHRHGPDALAYARAAALTPSL